VSLLISVTRKPSQTKPNREERKRKIIILIKKNEKGEKSEKKKNKSGPSHFLTSKIRAAIFGKGDCSGLPQFG
jgi:hypothetical protein